jgi:hypothetical protein
VLVRSANNAEKDVARYFERTAFSQGTDATGENT